MTSKPVRNSSITTIFALSLLMLFFTGCLKQDRKIIQNFETRSYDIVQEQDNVTLGLKELTSKELKSTFKTQSLIKRLYVYKRYKALEIEIHNKNNKTYKLTPESINLKTISTQQMSKKLSGNYYAPAIIIVPCAAASVALIGGGFYVLAKIASGNPWYILGTFLLAPFFTPALVSVAGTVVSALFVTTLWVIKIHKRNKKLNKKIAGKMLKKVYIRPYESIKTLIILDKKDIVEDIFITLFDGKQSKDLLFQVPPTKSYPKFP